MDIGEDDAKPHRHRTSHGASRAARDRNDETGRAPDWVITWVEVSGDDEHREDAADPTEEPDLRAATDLMVELNEQLVIASVAYEQLVRHLSTIRHLVSPHTAAAELNVSLDVAKALLSGSRLRLGLVPREDSTDEVTWWT